MGISISACSFRSSASSSSSSTGAGALVFPFTTHTASQHHISYITSIPLYSAIPSSPSFHFPTPTPSSPQLQILKGYEKDRELTFAIDPRGQRSLQLVLRHRARLEHLLVQVLLLQGCEVGFQLVLVDGFGDGHAGDCVADFLGEFVLLAELFPGAGVRCQ